MQTRVLILGAGFGGLEAATRLKELLGSDVKVTLIDKNDSFFVGFSKFEVMFGRKTPAQICSRYSDIAAPGVEFRQETVTAIDPANRRATTNAGEYEADVMVVALGADLDRAATPGLVEGGREFYSLPGAIALASVLPTFDSGTALIAVLGAPYKCPPAPFECALQLHDYLTARGVRERVTIRIATPMPTPLPVSKEGSEVVSRLCAERGIEILLSHAITAIDPAKKLATVKDREPLAYDLFMGVPVHRVPAVVAAAGLAPNGWVDVDVRTLETKFPNVYAVGDVTKIPVGAGMIPKAGAFADRAARAVADDIVHRVRGTGSRGHFDGIGQCYLEMGDGQVGKVDANYFGGPTPEVRFLGPSKDYRPDKLAFSSTRLQRWFKKA
ncbi:MAG: NAD(P)/FAD-dependent oxidoreductase [Polyangiales bacterium]